MSDVADLLAGNRAWAESITAGDPSFFARLARGQQPDHLWIGCSDSRVPANEILGLPPGEVFVHRNIANVVTHTDLNCLSVISYAVDVLRVRNIIVCGHHGCGGVGAVAGGESHGLIDNWLRHVRDAQRPYLHRIPDGLAQADRIDLLCELNVVEQVVNVSRTTVVEEAWARGQEVRVHGWVYGLGDGLLRDLKVTAGSAGELAAAHGPAVGEILARRGG